MTIGQMIGCTGLGFIVGFFAGMGWGYVAGMVHKNRTEHQ